MFEGILVATLLFVATSSTTQESPQVATYYCGVHSLYAAILYFDPTADFESLLKPEFVSSVKGSTYEDLLKAVNTHRGLYGRVIGNLTIEDLQMLDHPLVLHVKATEETDEFNHFVAWLPHKSGAFVVLDPITAPVRRIDLPELQKRWDGTALIVSDSPIHLWRLRWQRALDTSSFLIVIAALVAVIVFAYKRYRSSHSSRKSVTN